MKQYHTPHMCTIMFSTCFISFIFNSPLVGVLLDVIGSEVYQACSHPKDFYAYEVSNMQRSWTLQHCSEYDPPFLSLNLYTTLYAGQKHTEASFVCIIRTLQFTLSVLSRGYDNFLVTEMGVAGVGRYRLDQEASRRSVWLWWASREADSSPYCCSSSLLARQSSMLCNLCIEERHQAEKIVRFLLN